MHFKKYYFKISIKSSDICSRILCTIRAVETVRTETFLKDLKKADVTTGFKKGNTLLAENYRSVSALLIVF